MNNQTPNEQRPNLEIALINEVAGDNLKDLLAEGAELSIDHFLEEGVLKEIPFFGSLYKGYKTAFGIRESIFAKKIFKFLTELSDIPQEKREAFVNKLESNHEYRHKVGEKLLVLIEQLDDIEKPQIIGRLLKASINEKITYEEFLRLASIVDKGFLPDLMKLKDHPRSKGISQIVKEHFATIGIMSIEIKDKLRDQAIYRMASLGGGDKKASPKIKYEINSLGRKLIEHGIKDASKKQH
jgi:hypothetical protein